MSLGCARYSPAYRTHSDIGGSASIEVYAVQVNAQSNYLKQRLLQRLAASGMNNLRIDFNLSRNQLDFSILSDSGVGSRHYNYVLQLTAKSALSGKEVFKGSFEQKSFAELHGEYTSNLMLDRVVQRQVLDDLAAKAVVALTAGVKKQK